MDRGARSRTVPFRAAQVHVLWSGAFAFIGPNLKGDYAAPQVAYRHQKAAATAQCDGWVSGCLGREARHAEQFVAELFVQFCDVLCAPAPRQCAVTATSDFDGRDETAGLELTAMPCQQVELVK